MRDLRLFIHMAMVGAQSIRNLGEVTRPFRWHDGAAGGRAFDGHLRQETWFQFQAMLDQPCRQRLIQRGYAIIIETRRHGAKHWHVFGFFREPLTVTLVLLAHVAQRIFRALAVELVDRHEIGKIQHVDFFQLRRRAEFWRHHIQR